jgi:predicted nucleic acid-binding protein
LGLSLRLSGRRIRLACGECASSARTRQSPPVIDTMLAATAIEHGLHLVTRNIADVRHSGALMFNPWTD